MGSHKAGEVEYTGLELAGYIQALCKGNPVNIEVLFTEPARSVYEHPDWATMRVRVPRFGAPNAENSHGQRSG